MRDFNVQPRGQLHTSVCVASIEIEQDRQQYLAELQMAEIMDRARSYMVERTRTGKKKDVKKRVQKGEVGESLFPG